MNETEINALGFEDDTSHADQGRVLELTGHGLRLVFPAGIKLTPRDLVAATAMQAGADAVHAHQQKLRALLGFDLGSHGAVRVVR